LVRFSAASGTFLAARLDDELPTILFGQVDAGLLPCTLKKVKERKEVLINIGLVDIYTNFQSGLHASVLL
jgi:hypothetical protein